MPAAAAAYASLLAHVLLNISSRGGYVSARDPIARKAPFERNHNGS
jgi:hypothetical protein